MTALDKFGEFIITKFRDQAIKHYELLEKGSLRPPSIQSLQNLISKMKVEDKQIIQRCVVLILDGALHDLLSALQEVHDLEGSIEVLVDDKNIAQISGMLHGELFGEEGWVAKFSRYPISKDLV